MPRRDLTKTIRGDCSDSASAFDGTSAEAEFRGAIAIATASPDRRFARYTEIKLPDSRSNSRSLTHIILQTVLYLFTSAPVEHPLVCIA